MADETPGALIRRVTGIPEGEPLKGEAVMFMDGVSRTKAEKAAGYDSHARAYEVKGPKGSAGIVDSGEVRIVTWSEDDGDHEVVFRAESGKPWRRINEGD